MQSSSSEDIRCRSGVWQLNKERSKVESAMAWVKVGLSGSTFSVNMRTFQEGRKEEAFDWQFALGSAESSNTMHGAPMKSHAAWEGDALVMRSVTMFGSDALKTVDRWAVRLRRLGSTRRCGFRVTCWPADGEQFASQMMGRLLSHRGNPAIQRFIGEVAAAAPARWLRPLHPALHPPGTQLVR
jgi:hypothetical protein